eukprot:Gregarina_sp_Pseudo_9__445@NODE_1288_length_1714_cov_6_752239_g1211_i0_p1_GENE_NODE_1288_length_1714_cov_6_752239_g1211_i0NODE_1288_length_1714_cov_6_752239_g1211_i0_p1_ORF_typecomplete_len315_score67_51_NODE_1288_length_1714_cov_6_752239_g1211_i092946
MDQTQRMGIKKSINDIEDGRLIAKFVPRGLFTVDTTIWNCRTLVDDKTFDGFEIRLTPDLFESEDRPEMMAISPSRKQLGALVDFVHDCRDVELLNGQQAEDGALRDSARLYLGVSIDAELIDLEITENTRLIDTLRELRDDLDSISVRYPEPPAAEHPAEDEHSGTAPAGYFPSVFVGLKSKHPTVAVDTLSTILGSKIGVELDTSVGVEGVLKDICNAEQTIKFTGHVTLLNWKGADLAQQCASIADPSVEDSALMRWVRATPAGALAPSKSLRSGFGRRSH